MQVERSIAVSLLLVVCLSLRITGPLHAKALEQGKLWELVDSLRKAYEFEEANSLLNRALPGLAERQDWLHFIKAIAAKGDNFYDLNAYDSSMFYFNRCIKLFDEKDVRDDRLRANCYEGKGMNYGMLNQIGLEINHYNRALEIRQQLPDSLKADLALSYAFLASYYGKMQDYRNNLHYNQLALNVYLTNADPHDSHLLGIYYNNVGIAYDKLGDYELALQYFKKSLNERLHVYGDDHIRIARVKNNIAVMNGNLGKFQEELGILINEVLPICLQTIGEDAFFTSSVLRNIGYCYGKLGDEQKKTEYFNRTLAIREKILGEGHPSTARILLDISIGQRNNRDFLRAEKTNYKIISMLDPKFDGKHPLIGQSYLELMNIALWTENYDQFLEYGQKALAAVVEDYDVTRIGSIPDIDRARDDVVVLNILQRRASGFKKMHEVFPQADHLQMALDHITASIAIINKLKNNYSTDRTIYDLASTYEQLFDLGVEIAYDLYESEHDRVFIDQALSIAESNRSFVLLKALKTSDSRILAELDNALVEKERSMKLQIAYLENRMLAAREMNDGKAAESIADTIAEYRVTYDQFLHSIKEEQPQYFQLQYTDQNATVEDLRNQVLNDQEVLVEYVLTDSAVFAVVIGRQILNFVKIDKYDAFDSDLYLLLDQLKSPPAIASLSQSSTTHAVIAHRIYAAIVAPLEVDLRDHSLIIVPDGELGYLPFEALIRSPVDHGNFKSFDYLIHSYPISYAYSATYLQQTLNLEFPEARKNLLAMAPDFSGSGNHLSMALNEVTRDHLAPLLYSKLELQMISDIANGAFLYDQNASKANFSAMAPDYKVIHLATHSLVSDQDPMSSKLVFAGSSNSGNDSTGNTFLHTYELYNMRIRADLAVLSACNTGYGKLQKGEGILSLASGFAVAGCSSLIMSLWPANDKTTSVIMADLYRELVSRQSKESALRQAKLNYLEEADNLRSHPFYWANFIAIGNMDPIELDSSTVVGNWYWMLLSIPMLIIILYRLKRKPSLSIIEKTTS